jgi:aquaporin Z
MPSSAAQRYLAEFLGTFALLLFGGGAAVFSLFVVSAFDPLSRIVLVSCAFGFVVAGLAWVFGDISGGHFNPAVSVSMALAKRMPARDVVPYLIAQVTGALLGMTIVLAIVAGGPDGAGSSSVAATHALASQCYSASYAPGGCGFSLGAVLLVEVALTFVFVLVIQLVTRPESAAKNLAPLAIGLTLLVTNLTGIPVDGASINPARSFAPAVLSLMWPDQHWAFVQSWAFWLAPIFGGALAAIVYRVFRSTSN